MVQNQPEKLGRAGFVAVSGDFSALTREGTGMLAVGGLADALAAAGEASAGELGAATTGITCVWTEAGGSESSGAAAGGGVTEASVRALANASSSSTLGGSLRRGVEVAPEASFAANGDSGGLGSGAASG